MAFLFNIQCRIWLTLWIKTIELWFPPPSKTPKTQTDKTIAELVKRMQEAVSQHNTTGE